MTLSTTPVADALIRACTYLEDCDADGAVPNPEFYQAAARLVTTFLTVTSQKADVESKLEEPGLRACLLSKFNAAREIAEALQLGQELKEGRPFATRELRAVLRKAAQ